MSAPFPTRRLVVLALVTASIPAQVCKASAQGSNSPQTAAAPEQGNSQTQSTSDEDAAQKLMLTPWANNVPGAVSAGPSMDNPMANMSGSAERGMQYYIGFNCLGCHAPNGGGAIGPSLSNDNLFKFGPHPAQHYMVISHGAPLGMPAWGDVLPHEVVWDIISYIKSISSEPTSSWGTTVSPAATATLTEQVPYEFLRTASPWDHLQPFSGGKKPSTHQPSTKENVTDIQTSK